MPVPRISDSWPARLTPPSSRSSPAAIPKKSLGSGPLRAGAAEAWDGRIANAASSHTTGYPSLAAVERAGVSHDPERLFELALDGLILALEREGRPQA